MRPGKQLIINERVVITRRVNLARFRGSAELAPAVLGLELRQRFALLLHDANAIIEIVVPGLGML
jgi:hypothetical protein